MNKRQYCHRVDVAVSKDRKAIRKALKRYMPTFKAVPRWREIRHAKSRYVKHCILKGKLPQNFTEILYNRILDKIISKRRF